MMAAVIELNEPVAALIAALDADDTTAAEVLLANHDQHVRNFAEHARHQPDYREQLIALQRLQLALIELLRGRRDAIADELQSAHRIGKATRAYLSEGEP